MTDEYQYRCTDCMTVLDLPTNGEREITVGCPDCGIVQTFVRLYECVECGYQTANPYWPRDVSSADDGPLCNQHYGEKLINQT